MKLFAEKVKRERCSDGFVWAVVDNRGHLVAEMSGKGNSKSAERLAKDMCESFNKVKGE